MVSPGDTFDSSALFELAARDGRFENELTTIEGLVADSGQGSLLNSDQGRQVNCFGLCAWRVAGNPLEALPLNIRRVLPLNAQWTSREFAAYTVHRLRVWLSKDRSQALYLESTPMETSAEFAAIRQEIEQPIVIESTLFGELLLDRKSSRIECDQDWNGAEIMLSIEANENLSVDLSLTAAERLWQEQELWERTMKEFAARELLPLKNSSWLEAGEQPLSPQTFLSQISLTNIQVFASGAFEFWFDDGGLFLEHLLVIEANHETGPISATLAG